MTHHEKGEKTDSTFLKREWRSLLIAYAVVLIFLLPEFHGWFASMEGKAFDFWVKHVILWDTTQTSPEILVVTVDDKDYEECFERKSPLKVSKVKEMVRALAPHAKVLVVDLITDDHEYQNKDEILTYRDVETEKPDVREIKNVVWAVPDETREPDSEGMGEWISGGSLRSVHLGAVLGADADLGLTRGRVDRFMWGVPAFPLDEDGKLRRIPRYFRVEAPHLDFEVRPNHPAELEVPSLATRSAEFYFQSKEELPGKDWKEVLIDSRIKRPQIRTVRETFQCTERGVSVREIPKPMVNAEWTSIVLGGTFGEARDDANTPFGRISGLEVNAMAIEAELLRNQLRDPPKYLLVLTDLLIVTWLVWWTSRRTTIGAAQLLLVSLLVGVVGYAAATFVAAKWVGWVSWVGPLLGTVTAFVIEVVRKNPPLANKD